MLPNTSLMAPPSILMRVGSFNAIAASTETPSRASIRCRANTPGGLIAVSDATSDPVSSNLACAIVKLLEALQLNPVSRVVKQDDVLLLDVGGPGAVDEGRQAALQMNGQAVLVGDQLRDGKLGRSVQALQPVAFQVLARLQRAVHVRRRVLQQHSLFPLDRAGRHIEREIG